jgi:hypothetical protein
LPAVFSTLTGAAVAEAPFAPLANQPDYVVTIVESEYGKEVAARNVTHHGNWTRVDRIKDAYSVTEYFSADGLTNVRTDGQGSVVSFQRGREPDYSAIDREAHSTGERQAHLGENCTAWDVWRTRKEKAGYSLSRLSCVTDDGIELRLSYVGGSDVVSSAEATRVERRPVAPDEARPPRTLLTLDWWDRNVPLPTAPAIPDHETIMEISGGSSGPGQSIRATRRLGQWEYLEETVSDVRRSLVIMHDSHLMRFEYAGDKSGTPKRLTIMRLDPGPADAIAPTRPADMNRFQTILGETCHWFDMMPGMADAGRSACLMNDGIVLKDERYNRTTRETWTAVRLTRRPVHLDEIKPPAALLEPQLWGIE